MSELTCGTIPVEAAQRGHRNVRTLKPSRWKPRVQQVCRRGTRSKSSDSPWGWLNNVQQRRRSDRTASDESQTVKRVLDGSVRWSRPGDWNILHDYAGVRKETWEVLQLKLDWLHFSHAAMPYTKTLQIRSGISFAFQDWMYLFFFLELMDGA